MVIGRSFASFDLLVFFCIFFQILHNHFQIHLPDLIGANRQDFQTPISAQLGAKVRALLENNQEGFQNTFVGSGAQIFQIAKDMFSFFEV